MASEDLDVTRAAQPLFLVQLMLWASPDIPPKSVHITARHGGCWSIVTNNIFPGDVKYSANDIPDMSGKVVLVTGGTAGIGKETARVSRMACHAAMSTHSSWSLIPVVVVTAESHVTSQVLFTKNAKVWIRARDKFKGEATLGELESNTGRDAHLLLMDLANLKSIKAAAEGFLSQDMQLNVLFHNAPPIDQLTDDDYDLRFGTNVLGHFYFTKLVLPVLSIVKSAPDGTDLHGESNRSFHPQRNHIGGIKTEPQRHVGSFASAIPNWILYDVSYGAITPLYAGTVPDGASLNGKYLVPWAHTGKPRADTQDPQLGKELWTWLKEQVATV
ncbi:hypothetical protein BU15DRAFT_81605 [Melanogaster broomeanus]|nr:hypothetical protein BU15DRAFT_81605 [Melanogaster broomeanus]